jgi:hypothetical protein
MRGYLYTLLCTPTTSSYTRSTRWRFAGGDLAYHHTRAAKVLPYSGKAHLYRRPDLISFIIPSEVEDLLLSALTISVGSFLLDINQFHRLCLLSPPSHVESSPVHQLCFRYAFPG